MDDEDLSVREPPLQVEFHCEVTLPRPVCSLIVISNHLTGIFTLTCHPGINCAFLKAKCLKIHLWQAFFYLYPQFNYNVK